MGFVAMLADEYILIFLFAIGIGSITRNSIELLCLTSSLVILVGFSSVLDVINTGTAASPVR
jgi:hypothetical protein